MVQTLTWTILGAEQTHSCLTAVDVPALREVLLKVDAASNGKLLRSTTRNSDLIKILLDLYAHLLMFAKAHHMNPEKTSTLVSIMNDVHERSMGERLSRVASYDHLRDLIVRHSVARPPYSAAIFNITNVQEIDDYFLSTYYRHYKMYCYAFVPRQIATVRTVPLGSLASAPPAQLPALFAAMPVAEWRKKVEERERGKEATCMTAQQLESEQYDEKRQREAGLNDPTYTDGIKEQLEAIKTAVAQRSMDRLDVIEQKLTVIEAKVEESMSSPRPSSKNARKR